MRTVIILPHQLESVRRAAHYVIDCDIEFEAGAGWFYHSDVGVSMSVITFQNALEYLMQENEIEIDDALLEDAWTDSGDFGVWILAGKNYKGRGEEE